MKDPKDINILIACEESQAICKEFRNLGYNAFSCDIIPCSGGHPEWHIQADALQLIKLHWDLIIAHPPCTYLSNAGACRLYPKAGQIDFERYMKGIDAKKFFLKFLTADCKHIAVENPVPSKVFELPPYSQIIQPYEYGHPYTKKTCLWLKNLPLLKPTNIIKPIGMYVNGNTAIWKREAQKGQVIGKEKDKKHRSKTFPGIAEAIAKQWGTFLEEEEK